MKVQVIEKKKGRIDRTTGEIIKGNLRVCAYARVSTEKEEQLNSYNSQLKYYEEKIKSNSDWLYVGIYADEGITGTLDYKRDGFMKMMQDATQNKFDMIITKSISRFGRNTVDTLKYVRALKEKGIAIYFEEERINTLEISGEIMLTVLSAMAQQESENISSHVKLGLQMKLKRGELIGYNGCLGYVYDKESKQISVNYEEAETVRYIFERYCQGVGCTTIAKELTSMKYSTPTGKKKWHESTIRGILKNEKYKGDVLQGKTYTTDPISHRRVVNMGEENMYYMQEHHEPIISERMFNQAQEILQKRGGVRGSGRRKGNFSRKYPFSSRLYCGFCGSLLTRRNWHSGTKNSITVWHCMEFVKHGKENCPHCKAMKESIIEEAFTQSYKLLCDSNKELIQTFLDEMEEIIQEESNESSIKRLEKQKQILKEKIDKLIDLNLNGTISTEILQEKKAKLQNKISKIQKEQEHLQLEIEDSISLNQGLNKFKTLFKDNEIMPNFDKDVFELMIEKVIIGEKDSKGKINPRVITFILKSGNEIKCEEDRNLVTEKISETQNNINQQSSYEAGENYLQKVSEPCGVRCGVKSINGGVKMNLREQIENYKPYNEQEEKDKQTILKYIDTFDDVLTRNNEFGHFTASSWAVNKERTKVLMIYHNIYKSWAWTGGHADGESDLLGTAIRELKEETGVENVRVLNNEIFSLEIICVNGHIKRGKYVSSHVHLNLTYLLEVDENEILKIKEDENSDVKWVNIEDVEKISSEKWIVENVYKKLNEKLKII